MRQHNSGAAACQCLSGIAEDIKPLSTMQIDSMIDHPQRYKYT
jgi:hypothetical protein